MADDDDPAAGALREPNQVKAAAAELGDGSGRRRNIRSVHELDRIDQHERGPDPPGLLDDARDIALTEHEQAFAELRRAAGPHDGLEALGTQPDLLRTLLARCIQRRAAARRDRCRDLHQQRALADAGVAAEKHDRTGNHATAEHSVELADPGRHPRYGRLGNLSEGDGATDPRARELLGLGAVCRRAPDGRGTRLRGVRFDGEPLEAVPRAAIGALAHPLRVVGATLAAKELGAHLGHGARVYGRICPQPEHSPNFRADRVRGIAACAAPTPRTRASHGDARPRRATSRDRCRMPSRGATSSRSRRRGSAWRVRGGGVRGGRGASVSAG